MKPLIALFTALALAVSTSSLGYPEKLVRLVVPLPPGGHADIIARQIALQLSAQWKRKPGPRRAGLGRAQRVIR